MGSQVIGEDQSQLPRRETVGGVRRGRRRANNRAKERVYKFGVRFGRERRASCLPCLSCGLGDDRQSMSGNGDVSLAIFIAFLSGSESHVSFTSHFFHFRRPPGLRWRLMLPKGMEDLAAFSAREVKRAAAGKEKETSNPLQKDSESQSKRESLPSKLCEN